MACHSADGRSSVGPTWKGLYGSEVELEDGTTVTADDEYLVRAIKDPEAERVEGDQVVTVAPAELRLGDVVIVRPGGRVPADGEVAGRSAYALAAALGQEPVVFPGGHNGFLGGEFGQTGKPQEFAARLTEVLAATR